MSLSVGLAVRLERLEEVCDRIPAAGPTAVSDVTESTIPHSCVVACISRDTDTGGRSGPADGGRGDGAASGTIGGTDDHRVPDDGCARRIVCSCHGWRRRHRGAATRRRFVLDLNRHSRTLMAMRYLY
jgi:hypothetical protein